MWQRVIARRGFGLKDLQAAWDQGCLQISQEAKLDDIRVLTRTGELHSSADGYLYISRRIWWAWPFYGIFRLPGFNSLLWRGYRWFNRNRYHISRYCELPRPRQD
jgi:predicted DCC family thiol-disulfide oxidoreductase YuxK